MRSLLIDTTTSFVTVSIIEDDEILYNFGEIVSTDLSSKIMSIIEDGFNKVDFSLDDIDKIFVVNGPGSFTGIRVGVTVAKTIAWALKKVIVPISSLELMASTHTSKKYIVPMIDARRGNAFAGIYDNELNCIKEDNLVNISDFISNLNENYEFISFDNIKIDNIKQPNIDVLKVINKHKSDLWVNPHNLNPNYLKLTEAEENLRKEQKSDND